jgi:predicted secreted protein
MIWTVGALLRRIRRYSADEARQDPRGQRVVLAVECILNQNARDQGAAMSPAANCQVLHMLTHSGVGLVQMPCPEMECLGFRRRRPPGWSLRQALEADAARDCCAHLAQQSAQRAERLRDAGVAVIAVLGGNAQSPGCAVHPVSATPKDIAPASGIFIQELALELYRRGIDAPIHAMRDAEPRLLAEDLAWLRGLLGLPASAAGGRSSA